MNLGQAFLNHLIKINQLKSLCLVYSGIMLMLWIQNGPKSVASNRSHNFGPLYLKNGEPNDLRPSYSE